MVDETLRMLQAKRLTQRLPAPLIATWRSVDAEGLRSLISAADQLSCSLEEATETSGDRQNTVRLLRSTMHDDGAVREIAQLKLGVAAVEVTEKDCLLVRGLLAAAVLREHESQDEHKGPSPKWCGYLSICNLTVIPGTDLLSVIDENTVVIKPGVCVTVCEGELLIAGRAVHSIVLADMICIDSGKVLVNGRLVVDDIAACW
jgi:hypothetical protein